MNEDGLTLIEIIIGLALLSLAMLAATLSYISITRLQQKGISIQKVQQNGRYVLEAISRDARNATSISVSNSGQTMEILSSIDFDGQAVRYRFDSATNAVYRCVYPINSSCLPINETNISSDEIRVTNLNYRVDTPPDAPSYITIKVTFEQLTDSITEENPEFQRFDLTTIVSTRTNVPVGIN